MGRSAVKVLDSTHEKIRYAAALNDVPQAEIVEAALDEYIRNHSEDLSLGMKNASKALFGGAVPAVAYLLGVDPADVARVAGDQPPSPISARRALRPTPTEAGE